MCDGGAPQPTHRRPLASWAQTTPFRGFRRLALLQPRLNSYPCTGSTLASVIPPRPPTVDSRAECEGAHSVCDVFNTPNTLAQRQSPAALRRLFTLPIRERSGKRAFTARCRAGLSPRGLDERGEHSSTNVAVESLDEGRDDTARRLRTHLLDEALA